MDTVSTTRSAKWRAILAVLLIAPAPSVGVYLWLNVEDPTVKILCLILGKIWLYGGPMAWRLWVDREPLSWSPVRKGGLALSAASGVVIGLIILGAYGLIGSWIPVEQTKATAVAQGLDSVLAYLGIAFFIIAINSVLEEYVFRWFLFRKLEEIGGGTLGVIGSGLIFCVHHYFPLQAYVVDTRAVILCMVGIFVGGAFWSWMYLKYRSVWVPYVSHAIVDVGMLVVGAIIIFG
jgi:membrane protease YdiL (CAAX protease family)